MKKSFSTSIIFPLKSAIIKIDLLNWTFPAMIAGAITKGAGEMIRLRGHHIFCLIGYHGMGYSKEFVQNMTRIHQTLRKNPEIQVEIIEGPDPICEKYPNCGKYHCEDQNIYERDLAVIEKLGLSIGQVLQWEEIEERIRKRVKPSDIHALCQSCSWLSYGVCEEGIKELIEGKGLREIPEKTGI